MPRTDRQFFIDLYINGEFISTTEYLTSFEVTKAIGGWEGTFSLFDPSWTNLEALVLENGVGTQIEFTYGWRGESSVSVKGRLDSYIPSFEQEGLTLQIEWILGVMASARVKRNIIWSSGKRISAIVQSIAEGNGWNHEVEPTRGTFSQSIVQANVSDIYFIKNVLAPMAVNRSNIGGYKADLEDNKLIFKTIQNKDNNIYKSYTINRDMNGEAISFTPSDNVADIAQLGGRRVKIVSIDPLEKKVLSSQVSFKDTNTSLAKSGNKVSGVELDKDKNSPLRVIPKPYHKKEELDRYAKVKYAEYSQYNYEAELVVLGDPSIPLMGNVEVIVITPNNVVHSLSGNYKVHEVVDSITNGEFTSTLTLMRRSVIKGSDNIKGIKENLVFQPSRVDAINKGVTT